MIYNPSRFNESLPAGFDGQFHWDFLQGAFGPVVMPMDFDGVVERNGRFLLFETKIENASIPVGQRRSLEAAWKTGAFTILILWGKSSETLCMASVWDEWGDRIAPHPVTADTIYQYASFWWEYASQCSTVDSPWFLRNVLSQRDQEILQLKKALNHAHSKLNALEAYLPLEAA